MVVLSSHCSYRGNGLITRQQLGDFAKIIRTKVVNFQSNRS